MWSTSKARRTIDHSSLNYARKIRTDRAGRPRRGGSSGLIARDPRTSLSGLRAFGNFIDVSTNAIETALNRLFVDLVTLETGRVAGPV